MEDRLSLLTNLSGAQKLLLLVLLLAIFGILVSYWTQGLLAALLISLTFLAALWLARFAWLPPGYGKNMVRRASLGIALAVVGSYVWWEPLLNNLYQYLRTRYRQELSWLPSDFELAPEPSVLVLVFA